MNRDFLRSILQEFRCVEAPDIEAYFNNGERFGSGFIVTMEQNGRYENAEKTVLNAKIKAIKFRAISGVKLRATHGTHRAVKYFSRLGDGEIGCLYSFLCVCSLAADHPNADGFTFNFEDDVISNSGDISHVLQDIGEIDAERPVDLCYLGKCCENCQKMVHLKNNIWEADSPYCNHATLIKNRFAAALLFHLEMSIDGKARGDAVIPPAASDKILQHVTKTKMSNSIVVHPSVFFQDILQFGSGLRNNPWLNVIECRETQHRAVFRVVRSYVGMAGGIALILFIIYFLFWSIKIILV